MTIQSVRVTPSELKPRERSTDTQGRYEYCGFSADSLEALEAEVKDMGLQWHLNAVIDTQTGQKMAADDVAENAKVPASP